MNKIKIAYFGSSYFSASFLEKLITDVSINQLIETKLVVTQPDRKVGRKQILTPTPVKQIAKKYQILVFENLESRIQNSESKILNSKLKEVDIALLYAFSAIIPCQLLNLPKYGFWCIHPSLLPKYRGTSPMAAALINDDRETGVTIFKMDEKIDHGPIICQEKCQILPTDKRPDLETKLTDLALEMFKKIVNVITPLIPQQHELATYTKKLTKADGFIPFENLKKALNNITIKQYNNIAIYNLYRGLYPWPGLWTTIRVNPLKIRENPIYKRLKITDLQYQNGKLTILRVQLEGKKEVDFETFNKAYKIF